MQAMLPTSCEQWLDMDTMKLKEMLEQGAIPTSESLQALVQSNQPDGADLLALMLKAWPEGEPIDMGRSLDFSWHWKAVSPEILALLLDHGMKPTSDQLQGLVNSKNPETFALLTLMLKAWPEATPIDMGTSLDYSVAWEAISHEILTLLLGHGMTPSSDQLQGLVESKNPETFALLTLMLKAWPEGEPIDMGRSLDFSWHWKAVSPDSLRLLLDHGLTPTSKQLQALIQSDHPETQALLTLMLNAWPAETPLDMGTILDDSYDWQTISPEILVLLLDQGMVTTIPQIKAALVSNFPMTGALLDTMMQHVKKSVTFDSEDITDILRTILVHKSHDASMLGSLISAFMPHSNSINLQETLLRLAIQEWDPTHFMQSSGHQWIVDHLTASIGQDRFIEACHEKVSDLILQGHFHLADQFGAFCPEAWNLKSPVAWMTEAVAANLAHHPNPEQAQQAMQALMLRHLAVDTTPEDTVYFHEDLARDYFVRAKQASPDQADSDRMNDALRQWNQDFSAEIIRLNNELNNYQPHPITVFRGINLEQSWHEGMQDAWFDDGHMAFSKDKKNLKFFQFSFRDKNKNSLYTWEVTGTYVSLDPDISASFAVGVTSHFQGAHVLFESALPGGTIGVCGKHAFESELILPELMPDVIYRLSHDKRVLELFRHPDHPEVVARFQVGDVIEKTAEDEARYHALRCNMNQQSEPQTPDMLDDYYGFSLPDPVDHCTTKGFIV